MAQNVQFSHLEVPIEPDQQQVQRALILARRSLARDHHDLRQSGESRWLYSPRDSV